MNNSAAFAATASGSTTGVPILGSDQFETPNGTADVWYSKVDRPVPEKMLPLHQESFVPAVNFSELLPVDALSFLSRKWVDAPNQQWELGTQTTENSITLPPVLSLAAVPVVLGRRAYIYGGAQAFPATANPIGTNFLYVYDFGTTFLQLSL